MTLPDDFDPEVARFRELLRRSGLSMRAAARRLGMPRETFRKYAEAKLPIPEYMWLAAERLVEQREETDRMKEG